MVFIIMQNGNGITQQQNFQQVAQGRSESVVLKMSFAPASSDQGGTNGMIRNASSTNISLFVKLENWNEILP